MEEHFKLGCPNDTGVKKSHINISLLEHMDVSHEDLVKADHRNSPGCQCDHGMGILHKPHGLNSRDEIKSKSRCTY